MGTNVQNKSLVRSRSGLCLCLWAVFRSAISSLTWDLQDDRPVCGDVNNFGQANPGSPTDYSMDQVQYSVAGQGFTPLL